MMKLLQPRSIAARLTMMNLIVAVSALGLASLGFAAYDLASIREAIVSTTTSEAQIVAEACSAPLVFNDPIVAERTLKTVAATPNIIAATVYTPDGRSFAKYGPNIDELSSGVLSPSLRQASYRFEAKGLLVAAPVRAGDQQVGTLVLIADLRDLRYRVLRYLLIGTIFLGLAVFGALIVSKFIQRSIADPLVDLASTAEKITAEKNYTIRATGLPNSGELSVLVTAFNEMLSQIAERDRSLQQLAEESMATLRSIPQIVYTVAPEGNRVLLFNERWYEYTHMPRNVSLDEWPSYLHDEDRAATVHTWLECYSTGKIFRAHYRLKRHDGQFRWHYSHAIPLRDSEGRVQKWFGSCTDVHEQRQAEAALVQSEKLAAIGRLSASIAHEINNPLAAMMNVIHLLNSSPEARQQFAPLLDILFEETSRVGHIVKSTLGLSRQNSTPTPTELTALIDDVLVLFEKRLQGQGIQLEKRYGRDTCQVDVVASEIRQTISNLIGNAMDVSGSGSKISVCVHRGFSWKGGKRAGIRVLIIDQGPGIPPELQHRLFEPFFSTKLEKGTGLGLWISRGIAEKHGGTLTFYSRRSRDQHGTVFSLFLPFQNALGASAHGSS